jgi:hypothetical protein
MWKTAAASSRCLRTSQRCSRCGTWALALACTPGKTRACMLACRPPVHGAGSSRVQYAHKHLRTTLSSPCVRCAQGLNGPLDPGMLYATYRFTFDHVYDQHSTQVGANSPHRCRPAPAQLPYIYPHSTTGWLGVCPAHAHLCAPMMHASHRASQAWWWRQPTNHSEIVCEGMCDPHCGCDCDCRRRCTSGRRSRWCFPSCRATTPPSSRTARPGQARRTPWRASSLVGAAWAARFPTADAFTAARPGLGAPGPLYL